MLGPAFNGRYMSVEKPLEEAPTVEKTTVSSGGVGLESCKYLSAEIM